MKNSGFAYKVIDGLFIVMYGSEYPTDEEWFTYLRDIQLHGIERSRHLIFTDGGGPTAMQRRYLEKVLQDRSVPVAIVSRKWAIRASCYLIRLLGKDNLRGFPLGELSKALQHVGVEPTQDVRHMIVRQVLLLRERLR